MDKTKKDMFIALNIDNFPKQYLPNISDALDKLDDSKFSYIQYLELKKPSTIMCISIFLGWLGIDRFMCGENGIGAGKLVSCLFYIGLIWWIIDIFTASDRAKQYNYKKLQNTLLAHGVNMY